MSAQVEAETAAARSVLLDNLPVLRERLAEQEIRIEKFDVDVRRDGGQETGNSGADDRQARQSQPDLAPSPREPGGRLQPTQSFCCFLPLTRRREDGRRMEVTRWR